MTDLIPGITKEAWGEAEELYGFVATYLAMRFDEPRPIPDFHLEMWALCFSPKKQVAIAAPRNHAKSSAITFAYILYMLWRRKARHVLILGSNED